MMKKRKSFTEILCLIKRPNKVKNPGIVILIPTIILSGLILVVAIGLSQVLMTELEFSADLLFSEKAYFAAESGVEKSLLALKDRPLNWVDEVDSKVGKNATYDLKIFNSVEEFPFDLSKNETIKFRLGVDKNDSFSGYDVSQVHSFEIIPHDKNLRWKILCQNESGATVSLLGYGNDFTKGVYDDGDVLDEGRGMSTFLSSISSEVCFMSLTNINKNSNNQQAGIAGSQNLAKLSVNNGDISGKVIAKTLDKRIAPARTIIRSVGTSYSREKIVLFQYLQKNLSSLFDMGLYYVESEEKRNITPVDQIESLK